MTTRDRIVAALLARGEKELPSKSRKYRTFTRTHGGTQHGFYFVGKLGALRFGQTSTGSIALSDDAKASLILGATNFKPT